jgi:ribosomal protein S18 acetylase RimI-like enzyme
VERTERAEPPSSIELVSSDEVDPHQLLEHVRAAWGAESVVAHGERLYPARLPGFVAIKRDRIAGHVTFRIAEGRCEITSIVAEPRGLGIGSLLLEAALAAARESGCRVAWLTTTNDNLNALRFYQRRGFRLAALRPGAVDDARESLKPELPEIGAHGIPMRDELDLELGL